MGHPGGGIRLRQVVRCHDTWRHHRSGAHAELTQDAPRRVATRPLGYFPARVATKSLAVGPNNWSDNQIAMGPAGQQAPQGQDARIYPQGDSRHSGKTETLAPGRNPTQFQTKMCKLQNFTSVTNKLRFGLF